MTPKEIADDLAENIFFILNDTSLNSSMAEDKIIDLIEQALTAQKEKDAGICDERASNRARSAAKYSDIKMKMKEAMRCARSIREQ